MPMIKFDVSASDPEAAVGGGEPPKPGVYSCKIVGCKLGYKKKEDSEELDKSRPRIEVIYQVLDDGEFKGSQLYDYISLGEASVWKLDQFLLALGLASSKKRTGQWDPEKQKSKEVKVLVAKDNNSDGEYRAKVRKVLRLEGATTKKAPVVVEEEEMELEVDTELTAEEPFGAENLWTEEDLAAMDNAQLKEAAKKFDLVIKGMRRTQVVEAILDAQGTNDPDDEPF